MLSYRIELAHQGAHQFRVTHRAPTGCAGALRCPWIPAATCASSPNTGAIFRPMGRQPAALTGAQETSWRAGLPRWQHAAGQRHGLCLRPSVRTAVLRQTVPLQPSSLVPARAGPGGAVHRIEIGTCPRATASAAMARSGAATRPRVTTSWWTTLRDRTLACGLRRHGVPHEIKGGRRLAECRSGAPAPTCSASAPRRSVSGRRAFERYQFQLWTVDDGCGGLEHRQHGLDRRAARPSHAIEAGDLAERRVCACSASSATSTSTPGT